MDKETAREIMNWIEHMVKSWGVQKVVRDDGESKVTTQWSFGKRVEKDEAD